MALNLNIISKFEDKGVKQAKGAFDGMGKKLLGFGALVAGAFSVSAITNFAKESIAAAEGVAVANNRLDAMAKSIAIFGDQTQIVSDRLKSFAEANEFALATDAEVIKATQAKLLAFKGLAATADEAGGAFDRTTKAAIDLAAAGFGSAEANAAKLGRALEDPVRGMNALARSGVVFSESEKAKIKALAEGGQAAEAQNMILQALESRFAGTALATATASEKMKLAFDNVRETVGGALLPVFNSFADALLPLIEHILPILSSFLDEKIVPYATKASEAFKTFTSDVRQSGFDLGKIFTDIADGITRFLETGGLQRVFEKIAEMRMNFLNSVMQALPGIIDAFIQFIPEIIRFLVNDLLPMLIREFVHIITQLAQVIATALPKLVEALLSLVPEILKAAVTLFQTLVEAVVLIVPSLIKTIGELLPDIVRSILKMLPEIIKAAVELFTAIVKAIPQIIPPLITAILDLLPVIIDTVIDMLPDLISAAFDLFTGLITGLLEATPDIIQAVIDLVPQITGAILENMPKLLEAGFEIVKGLAEGIIKNAPTILAEAAKTMGTVLINGVKSLLGIKSPSKVFYDLGLDVGAGFVAGMRYTFKEIEKTADELALAAAQKAQDALNKAGITNIYSNFGVPQNLTTRTGSLFDVGKATDDLNAIYDYMGARTQEQMHDIERFVLGMTFQEALDTLFTGVNDGTDALVESINNISQRFTDLSESVAREGLLPDEVAAAMGSVGGGGGGLPTMALAAGGFVQQPVNAIVGEAGPEVVMPLDRFENLLNTSNRQPSVNQYEITINAGIGSDPVTIGRYVTDAIKRYESVSGKVFASA